jgi:asparagine synthase (glutamine-hydrolysing)
MSAILGRINLDGAPINAEAFQKAFAAMAGYGGDAAKTWIEGSVALGHHLLEITPESRNERQPHAWQNAVIVADARIDNRTELCDFFEIPPIERALIPDSHLILRAYRRWNEECTQHLLGDFAFAIWDQTHRLLFCARDHIGARPLYYYHSASCLVFATDIRALLDFPDADRTLDQLQIARYLIWPTRPQAKTFFKQIEKLKAGCQFVANRERLRTSTHWRPENAPGVYYRDQREYGAHLRVLLERAVGDRIRTPFAVGAHVSGGLDSSGVAVLANRALRDTGRSLDMTYTWSPPKSSEYPPRQGDERDRIEAICSQEEIPCQYGSATAQDLLEFLARDIAVEGIADLFEERPVIAHAGARRIRVLLTGWGGDEAVSYHGTAYPAELLRQGRIMRLLQIARQDIGGFRRIKRIAGYLFRHAVVPNLPNQLYSRYERTLPEYTLAQQHYLTSTFSDEFASVFEERSKISREFPGARKMQSLLLQNGHLAERMETWAVWSGPERLVHSYPLTDRRVLDFMLGLPSFLLNRGGKWRQTFAMAIADILPISGAKSDPANEQKRRDIRLMCWQQLAQETAAILPNADKPPWINADALYSNLTDVPVEMTNEDIIRFWALRPPLRAWNLWKRYGR